MAEGRGCATQRCEAVAGGWARAQAASPLHREEALTHLLGPRRVFAAADDAGAGWGVPAACLRGFDIVRVI